MKDIPLRVYQKEAIEAIQTALNRKQKNIIVEIPIGCGKGIVLAKTVALLSEHNRGKIIVVTHLLEQKMQLEDILSRDYFVQSDRENVDVQTTQKVLRLSNKEINEYRYVIIYDTVISDKVYNALNCAEKVVIVFSGDDAAILPKQFRNEDVVFKYTFREAVNDGFITPAMNSDALEPAVESFCENLLEQFGYSEIQFETKTSNGVWDFLAQNNKRKIWGEYRRFKNQVVSPSAANSLLLDIVLRKKKQNIPQDDIVLIMVFSSIPSFQKDVIFKQHGIIIWDIANLVYYSKSSSLLLKQLSQITYFPIDYVEGQISQEAEDAALTLGRVQEKAIDEAEKETDEAGELILRLQACKTGRNYSNEYEVICEEIIRYLFEATYFNRLTGQHKTKDEHFRMDLIGALKINQNNDMHIHPLWQMFVQHYNSHFVVFEFKNYSKEIDQNLIYITEKYLFDAALRNVVIIISRKGFSKAAKFAAEGCLKEHGKLILNVTDEDLIQMLKLKSDRAADYLMDILEKYLMGISK